MHTLRGEKVLCTETGFNGPLSVCFHRIRSILTSSALSARERERSACYGSLLSERRGEEKDREDNWAQDKESKHPLGV